MYDWRRFWCLREGRIQLDDDGFLLDPESKAAAYCDPGVVPFEKIAALPCLVLLGEPGLGKSTTKDREVESVRALALQTGDTLISADLREYGTDTRLCQQIFESTVFQEWRRGSHTLHLFLDSLDECLLRMENVSAVLLSELRKLRGCICRLRLRILCRTADWPPTLEQGLKELCGAESVEAFELAPLRRCDVLSAAITEGVKNPAALLTQIDALGAGPLASRPIGLRFLLNLHLNGKPLPTTRLQMYREGCKQLCETSQNRRDARRFGSLNATERLRVASRLAAVTQFCNYNAIWMGPDQGDVPPEDIVLDGLIDGMEGGAYNPAMCRLEGARETIGETGLFSSRGLHRMAWAHQTYGEFLAADYLHQHKMAPERMLNLVYHPDRSGKVVPQLREIAGWLAGMEPAVFRALARTDPETLLRSDAKSLSDADRAEIVANLLASYEAGEVWEDGGFGGFRERLKTYGRLGNAHLAEILRPYLAETTRHPIARTAAVDIAEACEVRSLQTELAQVALDPAQDYHLRIWAAKAVVTIGDASAKCSLKPLAIGNQDDDLDDELKGWVLRALWPSQVTANELFDALTHRKRTSFIGAYYRFLTSDVLSPLHDEDLLCAVHWAGCNLGRFPEIDPEAALAIKILVRALDNFCDDNVIRAIAQVLTQWGSYAADRPAIREKLNASKPARQRLLRAMLPLMTENRHGSQMLVDLCALRANDILWLLGDLQPGVEADRQSVLCRVIAWLIDAQDVDVFDAVLLAAKTHPHLRETLSPLSNPVMLGSQEAVAMRAAYDRLRRQQGPKQSVPLIPDVTKVRESLAGRRPNRFAEVCYILEEHPDASANDQSEVLSGWASLPADLQLQVIESAYDYLSDYRLPGSSQWWKEGVFTYGTLSGCWAFALLRREAPAQFERLNEQVWHDWAAAAICSFPGESPEERNAIVIAAYRRAPGRVLQVLDDIIDGENERHGTVLVLPYVDALWDDRISCLLQSKLTDPALKPGSFGQILAVLLKRGDSDARGFAETRVKSHAGEPGISIAAATQLALYTPDAAWPLLWPNFQANPEWGKAVCLQVVELKYLDAEPLAAKLNDVQLADLFLWLSPLAGRWRPPAGAHVVHPSESLSRWCDSLPSLLADRGTPAACAALRRICAARPDLEALKWCLRGAEDLSRRNTWVPCSPKEIIELAHNPAARLVRGGEDLLKVLVESLTRLEGLLHGETPQARFLWDERVSKPKDESAVSDWVKMHFNLDLIQEGVIVNREVEIRVGQETDIHVDVAVPAPERGNRERITAIVEVKGCWNQDLDSAMETQLVNRYLSEGGYGLYVVAWFSCARWAEDYRRERTPKITLEEARRMFEAQAESLSTGSLLVRAVVLDVSLK